MSFVERLNAPVAEAGAPTASERRDCFPALVAHELRAPIALQRALVEVTLADPDADTAALRKMGERVLASCVQQQRLIELLLDLACSGGALARREPIDLATIAAAALRAHDLSGLQIVLALEPAHTSGDPDLLLQLAANLVSNASRHNIAGGSIEVATSADAGRAVISIANTGPLIQPRELQLLIRRPFQRLGANRTRHHNGHGLGLSIVDAIATAHGAQLKARARTNGGLTIEVSFPPPSTDRASPVTLVAAKLRRRAPGTIGSGRTSAREQLTRSWAPPVPIFSTADP
jgi:signal transduction histidine kinase